MKYYKIAFQSALEEARVICLMKSKQYPVYRRNQNKVSSSQVHSVPLSNGSVTRECEKSQQFLGGSHLHALECH